MRTFSLAALAVVPISAQWQWSTFYMREDNSVTATYFATQPTSTFSLSNSNYDVSVQPNKAVFMKTNTQGGIDSMYKPDLLGGSVSYIANVNDTGCGCVSGLYLVKTGGDCDQDPTSNLPTCPSFDLMEASKYGFNTNAHPCANGTCDARSQCDLKTKEDGIAKYGANAYGPGGSLINTAYQFGVKTEFISDADQTKLMKLRTTLAQGTKSMVMEAECEEYLSSMSGLLKGEMGFILSSWTDKRGIADIAPTGTCSTTGNSCTANSVFKSFAVAS